MLVLTCKAVLEQQDLTCSFCHESGAGKACTGRNNYVMEEAEAPLALLLHVYLHQVVMQSLQFWSQNTHHLVTYNSIATPLGESKPS